MCKLVRKGETELKGVENSLLLCPVWEAQPSPETTSFKSAFIGVIVLKQIPRATVLAIGANSFYLNKYFFSVEGMPSLKADMSSVPFSTR